MGKWEIESVFRPQVRSEDMKEINPDVHALIASGFPQSSKSEALLREGVSGFLDKPYRIEELSRVIAKYTKVGAI